MSFLWSFSSPRTHPAMSSNYSLYTIPIAWVLAHVVHRASGSLSSLTPCAIQIIPSRIRNVRMFPPTSRCDDDPLMVSY